MESYITNDVEQTHELGVQFASRLGVGDCVALVGDLGAGKTAFVRGVAKGMGVADPRAVSSPTFVLMQEYHGRTMVYHLDLYRLSAPAEELRELGLDELLADGVVLIEWAERAGNALPRPRWQITVEHLGPDSRRFTIERIP
jgi:tRNA threonylcarbamoyladenosine biosynthesis protein TsaE